MKDRFLNLIEKLEHFRISKSLGDMNCRFIDIGKNLKLLLSESFGERDIPEKILNTINILRSSLELLEKYFNSTLNDIINELHQIIIIDGIQGEIENNKESYCKQLNDIEIKN